ncbi:MAG: hypothetical protein COA79_08370 [Planctomycetota bacterium]|nr:MAG: hypothetical protein COA79_08370 [Planctomycetota bacterium]
MSKETKPIFMPSVDIFETENTYEFIADMPGLDSKNIQDVLEVVLEKGQLKLIGNTYFQKPEGSRNVKLEYIEGKYQRIFKVGADINEDDISGKYVDGVLYLTLLKKKRIVNKISIAVE